MAQLHFKKGMSTNQSVTAYFLFIGVCLFFLLLMMIMTSRDKTMNDKLIKHKITPSVD